MKPATGILVDAFLTQHQAAYLVEAMILLREHYWRMNHATQRAEVVDLAAALGLGDWVGPESTDEDIATAWGDVVAADPLDVPHDEPIPFGV